MASTYSTSLRLELIGNGDQSGTWGTTTNTNLGTLIEQAITGVQNIVMTDADYTMSNYNGVSDEARNAVLVVTGSFSANRNLIAPAVNKTYVIYNNTSGGYTLTIKTASGTGIAIPNGATQIVYCNSTNFFLAASQTNVAAGTGISVSTVGTTATVTNTGVTSLTGTSNQITVSASTGGVTLSTPQAIGTSSAVNFGSVTTTGAISSSGSTVSDSLGNLRNLPILNKTSFYALSTSDAGQVVSITTGGVSVPASSFTAGQAVTIYNNSGSSQTITQNAGATMYLAAYGTTGNRTLAAYGMATIICIASNTFVISGSGVS